MFGSICDWFENSTVRMSNIFCALHSFTSGVSYIRTHFKIRNSKFACVNWWQMVLTRLIILWSIRKKNDSDDSFRGYVKCLRLSILVLWGCLLSSRQQLASIDKRFYAGHQGTLLGNGLESCTKCAPNVRGTVHALAELQRKTYRQAWEQASAEESLQYESTGTVVKLLDVH